ncbi:DUF2955 domain-containing protein [Variovorax sp. J31P179]|uniref:DUF2955 domain-containing protein n=1 Tax=Variovorax sp. J31P179 TaxID=3053508 RepID=UPI002576A672|nr:DUF2955 domain-containing protein [Variovorax sp. J31P179]MDM0081690.1 DUF2955 domain-containing protein [Variovorax sp. J31P179]
MNRADKAVLRLAIGLGLAVLIAYGMALPAPFVVCVMTVLLLCKPGPPIPFVKGAVLAIVIGALLLAGVLMVPILEHYALAGILLTGVLLYAVFCAGARRASPMTIILVIAFTLIPVAGVADQALVSILSVALAVGLGTGVFVAGMSHALFPDAPLPSPMQPAPAPVSPETANWTALRATLVVMPVFVLALSNPSFYLAAIIKTVTLGQQASSANARTAGRELVGSTLMGAAMAAVLWIGLTLRPNLWMLMLWMAAAALWAGARLFGLKATSFSPSFWSNALVTMLILLGPAIEDSASGKDVYSASAIRVGLFIAVALYACATVWALERWRNLWYGPCGARGDPAAVDETF